MTNYLEYHSIPIHCYACQAPHGDVHMHIMWSNQYGACVRLFCKCCGSVYDVTYVKTLRAKKCGFTVPHSRKGHCAEKRIPAGSI